MCRPLLLLDIDGVISLFGFDPQRPPAGRFVLVDGTVHFLSATAAELVGGLAESFELAWCSGWEERADAFLPSALGLPRGLAHLTFGGPGGGDAPAPRHWKLAARHWKLAAIERFAAPERPLAWIDDAHDDSCRRWASRRAAPTMLVATEPSVGLTAVHARTLHDWAAAL